MDESTWRLVRHGAHASELADGGFRAPRHRRRCSGDPATARPPAHRARGGGGPPARDLRARRRGRATPESLTDHRRARHRQVAPRRRAHRDRGRRRPAADRPLPGLSARASTYWPLREIVLQAKGDRSIDELVASLGIAPSVAHQVAAAVGLEEGEAGEDAGWAFLRLIDALARVQPLILVIDDAHLAEPALLDLLLDVADAASRRARAASSGWPAPTCSSGAPTGRAASARTACSSSVRSRRAASVDAARGDRRRSPRARTSEQRIAEAAGRQPAVPRAARGLRRRAASRRGPAPARAPRPARGAPRPARRRRAVRPGARRGRGRRVRDRSGARARRRHHPRRAGAGLRPPRRRDLLVPSDAGADGGSLRFRHGLVREAAYASLAKSARARLHERHAEWLDGLGSDLPEADARIGFHLETACRYEAGDRRAARRPSSRPGPAGGSRPRPASRAAAAICSARSAFSTGPSRCSGPSASEGAALLPGAGVGALRGGISDRAEELADRAVSASASLGLSRRRRAGGDRARADPALPPPRELRRRGGRGRRRGRPRRRSARLGDELGLARAAYLMSDLAWLMGDPVASYAARASGCSPMPAAPGAGSTSRPRSSSWPGRSSRGHGPRPRRSRAAMRSPPRRPASEPPSSTLRGCRAVLTAMAGRLRPGAHGSMAEARAGLARAAAGQ